MVKDKRDVAFKPLAEECFRLSHTIRLADNEIEREHHECCEFGHLFRLIPLLCSHNIMALGEFTILLDIQDRAAIKLDERLTH